MAGNKAACQATILCWCWLTGGLSPGVISQHAAAKPLDPAYGTT